jgi:hypothetical protein
VSGSLTSDVRTARPAESSALNRDERRVLAVYTTLLVVLIFFQKVGVPSAVRPVPFILPVAWAAILLLAIDGRAKVDIVRLLLYFAFAFIAIISNMLLVSGFKISSLLIVLAIYGLFAFRIDVSENLYRACAARFITFMLWVIPAIVFQWAAQLALHPGLWGNLQAFIPDQMLIKDYHYVRPLAWDSPWLEPNGIVFLEVSILSQFLTLAFLLEFSLFQRWGHLITLGLALLATLAASGPFMLAACAPLIALRFPRRLLLPSLAVLVTLGVAMTFTGVFSHLLSRTAEASDPTSSAYSRLVHPAILFTQYLSYGGNVLQGMGAGSSEELNAFLPIVKITLEYGVLGAACLMALFVYAIGSTRSSAVFVWAIFVFYNFMGGGFATPIYPLTCLLLCGWLVRPRDLATARPSER